MAGGGGQGYLGNSQGSAWALPEGDDLLGLTAHTPGQTPLQQPATPVQGWLAGQSSWRRSDHYVGNILTCQVTKALH